MMYVLAASTQRLAGDLGGHHGIHYGGSSDFFLIKCVWKLQGVQTPAPALLCTYHLCRVPGYLDQPLTAENE